MPDSTVGVDISKTHLDVHVVPPARPRGTSNGVPGERQRLTNERPPSRSRSRAASTAGTVSEET